MRFADKPTRYAECYARLSKRRGIVVRTLEYLNAERKIVDASRVWITPSAQRRRRDFLDEIHAWYDAELKKINSVLERLNEPCAVMRNNYAEDESA